MQQSSIEVGAFEPVPLERTLGISLPPRSAVIENVIDRGEIGFLAAVPGTSKTPLVTQLASCVAMGHPFLNLRTTPGDVTIIDSESLPDKLREMQFRQWTALGESWEMATQRMRLFVRGVPDDPNSRELERVMQLGNFHRLKWMTEICGMFPSSLLVVDTALTFVPLKSSDEEGVRTLFKYLQDIRSKPGAPAILLTLHLRKKDRKAKAPSLLDDPFDWTQEVLGSVVWSTSVDVRLGLERQADDRVVLAGYRRGRGVVGPFLLQQRLDESGEPVLWESADPVQVAGAVLSARLSQLYQAIPVGKWLSWTELLRTTNAAKSQLSSLVNSTVPAGLLERDEAQGRYRRPG